MTINGRLLRSLAQALIDSNQFDDPIVTQIEDAKPFYEAEEEHQEFYRKNPERFAIEEAGGREKFVNQHWQKSETK